MPHSGVQYNRKVLAQLDMLLTSIPEVELTVGKMGRVESALDPAPISMYENVINYKSEYMVDERGHRVRYRVNDAGEFELKDGSFISNQDALKNGIEKSQLIPDDQGSYFRNWRPEINTPDDIWEEIVKVTNPTLSS
jgi:Cu(I)/Ag(I) efflux system membrane protein CusA/SilA